MENIYIIGDVHGCYKSLLALIEQLPRKFDSKIYFVGDLIDRGPASADVFEFVRLRGYDAVMGNHEKRFVSNAKTALRCAKTGKFTSSNDLYAFFSLDESWLFNNGGGGAPRRGPSPRSVFVSIHHINAVRAATQIITNAPTIVYEVLFSNLFS